MKTVIKDLSSQDILLVSGGATSLLNTNTPPQNQNPNLNQTPNQKPLPSAEATLSASDQAAIRAPGPNCTDQFIDDLASASGPMIALIGALATRLAQCHCTQIYY